MAESRKKRLGRIGAVSAALALIATLALGAAPAYAAGTSYDNTDPASTGCASGSSAIKTYPINRLGTSTSVGTLEVRYSPGCVTNWVRVYNTLAGTYASKWMDRDAGPGLAYNQTAAIYDPGVGWSYGDQLYAPGCIHVNAGIWDLSSGATLIAQSGSKYLC